MILVYPNCYGLPVLKQTDYEGYTRSEDFEENEKENEEDNKEENADIFNQYDDEYINETIKKRYNTM